VSTKASRPPPGSAARIVPFGDAAVFVELGDRVDVALAERAQEIAAAIDDRRGDTPGLGRPVPAHASVLVPFDPLVLDLEAVTAIVAGHAGERPGRATGAEDRVGSPEASPVEIVVRYGGDDGPDLDEVADRHDLRPTDVVELHAGAAYRVLFLGFAPGFAYLGGLPATLVTPRKATPRARVPAGSVGIAGEQTGVYPLSMPGGWQLIGRTETRFWDAGRASPALLRPGDRVRFVPAR
jgi:KipI family sensor histidine kinase inhibitor